MQRDLGTFPIHGALHSKLINAGFKCVSDVIDFKVSELSKELDISTEEALDFLQLLKNSIKNDKNIHTLSSHSNAALQIMQMEKQSITTFSEKLDELLSGGIQLGKITEICGPPSIGKTQLCFQLVVDVQIPQCLGGVGGEAIYIDTEGSFVVERVVDIARAAVLHCQSLALNDDLNQNDKETIKDFYVKSVLSRIHYFRCFDYIQLIALMHTLDEFLKTNGKIRLIVLDSLAYVFRHDFNDFSLRSRLLSSISQTFKKFCSEYQLAVVLTNHMTTKFGKNQSSFLVPALGESWGHSCTFRIILHWIGNVRHALLYKSPSKQESSAAFQVTVAGIRDCVKD